MNTFSSKINILYVFSAVALLISALATILTSQIVPAAVFGEFATFQTTVFVLAAIGSLRLELDLSSTPLNVLARTKLHTYVVLCSITTLLVVACAAIIINFSFKEITLTFISSLGIILVVLCQNYYAIVGKNIYVGLTYLVMPISLITSILINHFYGYGLIVPFVIVQSILSCCIYFATFVEKYTINISKVSFGYSKFYFITSLILTFSFQLLVPISSNIYGYIFAGNLALLLKIFGLGNVLFSTSYTTLRRVAIQKKENFLQKKELHYLFVGTGLYTCIVVVVCNVLLHFEIAENYKDISRYMPYFIPFYWLFMLASLVIPIYPAQKEFHKSYITAFILIVFGAGPIIASYLFAFHLEVFLTIQSLFSFVGLLVFACFVYFGSDAVSRT